MLKLLIGYLHLLATSIALGSVLLADWQLYRGRRYPIRAGALSRVRLTSKIASASLATLWITGLLLIAIGYAADPAHFLANQKLWAKLTVVGVVTLNGWLLHLIAFPTLGGAQTFVALPPRRRSALVALAAISAVSWLYAALLGMARAWDHNVSYIAAMAIYLALLALAVGTSIALVMERAIANPLLK